MRFRPLIPHAEIKHHPGKQPALSNAQEETRDYKPGEVLRYAEESGDDSPGEHECGQPEAWGGAFEDYVAGDFEENLLVGGEGVSYGG